MSNFTRRSFFKRSALFFGFSALATPFDLFAEEHQTEDVWAFASDMHIADWTPQPPEYNTRFQAAMTALLAEPVKPRRLFLLGDNVALGKPEQYKRLHETLKPVVDAGIGIHASMGDHDLRENFQSIRKQLLPAPEKNDDTFTHIVHTESWQNGEVKHLEIIETKRANFFVLDSHDKLDQDEGKFGKNQLDWLAAELDQRKDKPAILMAHHPAVDLAKSGLFDAADFWKVLGTQQQVKAFFFGHTHFWVNYRIGRVHQVNVPATSRCAPITVLGWVLMTLYDDGLRLTLKTCDPQARRNGETVNLKWK